MIKWICVKGFEVKDIFNFSIIGEYIIGDIITTEYFPDEELDDYDLFMPVISNPFFRNLTHSEIKGHFVAMSEFREEQIKSVLDD